MLGVIIRSFNPNTIKMLKPATIGVAARHISINDRKKDMQPDFYNLVSSDEDLAREVGDVIQAEWSNFQASFDVSELSSSAYTGFGVAIFAGHVAAAQLIADHSFADLVSGGYFV